MCYSQCEVYLIDCARALNCLCFRLSTCMRCDSVRVLLVDSRHSAKAVTSILSLVRWRGYRGSSCHSWGQMCDALFAFSVWLSLVLGSQSCGMFMLFDFHPEIACFTSGWQRAPLPPIWNCCLCLDRSASFCCLRNWWEFWFMLSLVGVSCDFSRYCFHPQEDGV